MGARAYNSASKVPGIRLFFSPIVAIEMFRVFSIRPVLIVGAGTRYVRKIFLWSNHGQLVIETLQSNGFECYSPFKLMRTLFCVAVLKKG